MGIIALRRPSISGGQGRALSVIIMAYEPDTYRSAGAATLNTTLTVGGK